MNKNKKPAAHANLLGQLFPYFYYFVVSTVLFFVSILIPAAWLLFTTTNFLDVIFLGLLFPSLAALVSCSIKFKESTDKGAMNPFKLFIEGYRKNVKDTAKYCFIYGALLFVVIFNLNQTEADVSQFMMMTTMILAGISTLIVTFMMLIAAKFQFRLKDLFKVSIYAILMNMLVTVKIVLTFLVLFFLTPRIGLLAVMLYISPIVYLVTHFATPMLADIHKNFVDDDKAEAAEET